MTDTIYSEKKKYSKALKDFFKFQTKNKATWLIVVEKSEDIDFLLDGLEILSCDFVVKTEKQLQSKTNVVSTQEVKKDLMMWFDFVLTDNHLNSLQEFFQNGIIPIIPENNHLSSILREFDPLSSEGNSYLYKDENKWSMYYALIRYLENYKFPYDNRNLVKNIINL